jgi:hypothetical protein
LVLWGVKHAFEVVTWVLKVKKSVRNGLFKGFVVVKNRRILAWIRDLPHEANFFMQRYTQF